MRLRVSMVALALALTAAAAGCAGSAEPRLTIQDAWARPAVAAPMAAGSRSMGATPEMGGSQMASGPTTSAIYFVVVNQGRAGDALLEVRTAAAERAEIHETTRQGDTMQMQPVERVPIPAGGRAELKPGGYHVMLMGLKQALEPGQTIDVTLRFATSPEQTVRAVVREP